MKKFVDRLMELSSALMKEFLCHQSQLTIPELWALQYLVQQGSVTMKELSSVVSLKTSSTTSLVDRLIDRDYVMRNRCEQDRRVIWVRVTVKGKNALKKVQENKRNGFEKIFRSLSKQERDQYLQILEKIVMNIEEVS